MPEYTVSRLEEALDEKKESIKDIKVGLLGLSYKSNVADLRESPSLKILDILKDMGVDVVSYDPYIADMSDVDKLETVLDEVDAVILSTYHDIFGDLTKEILKRKNIKVVVDGMNNLEKEEIKSKGVVYRGIG